MYLREDDVSKLADVKLRVNIRCGNFQRKKGGGANDTINRKMCTDVFEK